MHTHTRASQPASYFHARVLAHTLRLKIGSCMPAIGMGPRDARGIVRVRGLTCVAGWLVLAVAAIIL